MTLRILTYLGLALALLAGDAEAGVGDMSGGALSSLAYLSPAQTAQYAGDCWYDNGWNGPGYYPCGNEWNSRPDVASPIAPIIVPAVRRHHRHGAVVARPAPKPIYPSAPYPRLGAGVPSGQFHGSIGASGVGPGWRRLGAGSAGASPFHSGAAAVTPGFAGGGFHGGLGGGNFRQFHNAAVPHIGAPVSPGFARIGGFHPGGAIGIPHIGAPVSPGFTGVGGFHPGGAIGIAHIGAPASPGFAGVGTFHGLGGVGAPHIGAPGSPGLAGVHGVGGGGVFQGGGAFGQGGIGHR
jgi:hypothetical protein